MLEVREGRRNFGTVPGGGRGRPAVRSGPLRV